MQVAYLTIEYRVLVGISSLKSLGVVHGTRLVGGDSCICNMEWVSCK